MGFWDSFPYRHFSYEPKIVSVWYLEHAKNVYDILQPLGAETYAEACQTSNMELFAKIVKGWKPVTIFIKSTIFFTLLKALLKFPYIFEYSRSIWMFSNYYLEANKTHDVSNVIAYCQCQYIDDDVSRSCASQKYANASRRGVKLESKNIYTSTKTLHCSFWIELLWYHCISYNDIISVHLPIHSPSPLCCSLVNGDPTWSFWTSYLQICVKN